MRCDAMRCAALRCAAMRCDAMRCDAVAAQGLAPAPLRPKTLSVCTRQEPFSPHQVFPRGVAVHGLDLEMRSGSISALLGANGAGKTTTISMLTGLIPPTAGEGFINGLSIKTDMRAIRASIGVCPQQNVLFDSMTPRLHLRLYAALKGLRGREMDDAVEAILSDVGLSERGDTNAAALSGGQKRKLCLAISLIGRSSTLFLDEPTSGMDPHSRRSIWAPSIA